MSPLASLALYLSLGLAAPAGREPALSGPAHSAAALRQEAAPPPPEPEVFIPATPNPVCPIMGKPISSGLFVDTHYGRMYLCCKPCAEGIEADLELAYHSSFPEQREVLNATCPVTGKPIPDEPAPAVVALQGLVIRLCSAECAPIARETAQVVLAKLSNPAWVHVDNRACPLTGAPAGRNTIVVVRGHIVHVADPKLLERIREAPGEVLAKAQEIAASEAAERKRLEEAERKRLEEAERKRLEEAERKRQEAERGRQQERGLER